MSEETVYVAFTVPAGGRERFLTWLQNVSEQGEKGSPGEPLGYRADDTLQRRAALTAFVDQMELKLRKNDHKSNWRDKPPEALFGLLLLEVEEFKIHNEFFTVGEARPELVDIANFAMILWDRLGQFNQERNAKEQQT